jgi:hypothetical protein
MRKPLSKTLLLALPASGLLLTGCGGSDSPETNVAEPPPAPPFEFTNADFNESESVPDIVTPGVYAYSPVTVGQNGGLFPNNGVVLISDTGRVVVAGEQSAAFARVEAVDGSLVAPDFTYVTDAPDDEAALGQPTVDILDQVFRARPDPLTPPPEVLSGTIEDEAEQLVESFQVQLGQTNAGVSFADIAGTYRFSRPDNGTTTFQIASDGEITGSDTSGCSWVGLLRLPNSGSQLLEASLDAQNCGSSVTATGPTRDGAYAALGFYDATQETVSLYMLSDDYATRFVAQSDSYVPPVVPAPFAFVSENNELEPSVQSRLTPGVFDAQIEELATGGEGTFEPAVAADAFLSPTGRIFINHPDFFLFSRIQVNNTDNFGASAALATKPNTTYNAVDEIFRGIPDIEGNIEDNGGDLLYRYSMTPSLVESGTAATMADVAGSYSETGANGITTNILVYNSGNFTGSDSTGCVFSGELFFPDQTGNALNIIEVDYTASGCGATPNLNAGARDGEYNGVGYYQLDLGTLTFGYANTNITGLFESQ